MNTKRISPQAIIALEHALSVIYWYKNDLKKYLYRFTAGHLVPADFQLFII